MKRARRAFFGSLAAALLAGLVAAAHMRRIEPSRFEVTKKKLQLPHVASPFRALHLSDFHRSDVVALSSIAKAIELGMTEKPDIVFLTGDFITWDLEDPDGYAEVLRALSRSTPAFACAGNHDGGSWAGSSRGYASLDPVASLLNRSGIELLFNEARAVEIQGNQITLAGLGDLWAGDSLPETALKERRSLEQAVVVLSHNPDSKTLLEHYDWDLLLCGHTHGGQLVVPLLGYRPFLPIRDKRFAEGLHAWKRRWIHITRGVGNLHGLRFNCRPEVSLLEIGPTAL